VDTRRVVWSPAVEKVGRIFEVLVEERGRGLYPFQLLDKPLISGNLSGFLRGPETLVKIKRKTRKFHSATLYTIEPNVSSAGSIMLSEPVVSTNRVNRSGPPIMLVKLGKVVVVVVVVA
jgi:hypothetical protein